MSAIDISNMWVRDIFTKIFSKVKTLTYSHLKSKYPRVLYTTTDIISDEANFPTIYMYKSTGVEVGQDLENKTINATRVTITIKVTSNREDEADYCIWYILMAFKSLGFNISSEPLPQNIDKKFIKIATVNRVIGSADIIE